MSTTTLDRRSPAARTTTGPGLSAPRILASEWIKAWTLRSTTWTVGLTVVLMTGVTGLLAWAGTVSTEPDPGQPGVVVDVGDAASLITAGAFLAQVVLVVLGVLLITGEYRRGMVRSTMAAVPRRLPVLWAKATVLAVVALATGAVAVVTSALVSAPFHDRLGVTLDLTSAETLRILGGLPLYLAGIALYGFALAALLRSSAAALAIVLGQLLVLETLIANIPMRAFEVVAPFLPGTAGQRLIMDSETLTAMDSMGDGAHLTPWQGYGVLLAWVAVLLTAAAVRLRKRDV